MTTCNLFRNTCLGLLLVNLTACVDLTPMHGHALSSTAEQRFSDEVIARDWSEIDHLRERLAAVRPKAVSSYALARAEALLEFGAIEYAENDNTGVLEPVLDDALRLLNTQEAQQKIIQLDLPNMTGIRKVRLDLWQKTAELKQDPVKLACAGIAIARLEVALLEFAHEQYEVDVKLNTEEHTAPYVAFVDALNKVLDEQLARCSDGTMLQHWLLSADALFHFDKFSEADILPSGKPKLDAFAEGLLAQRAKGTIKPQFQLIITGHTDRLGGHGYNITLGQRRADTVRDYLVHRHGLSREQIETRSMAYAQPIKYCTGVKITDELKACLQPNRRVAIELRQ